MKDPRDSVAFVEEVKRRVIVAMFTDDELMDRFVLKGGNLLDVVYGLSSRSSVDVDLSMEGEFENEQSQQEKISSALTASFAETGYMVFDFTFRNVPPGLSEDMKDFWGGYRIEFKLIPLPDYDRCRESMDTLRRNAVPIGKKRSTKFRIDISKHEFCGEKQQYFLDEYQVFGYSPVMFVCEKLRAICQQMPEYIALVKGRPTARARDFVDIHTVTGHYDVDYAADEFAQILNRIFEVKRVPLSLLGKIKPIFDTALTELLF
jgi:hypothetical protein